MDRSKKLVIVSHCILNQNSVVKNLAKKQSHFKDVLKPFFEEEIGIVQLPCPELMYGGLTRPDASYEDYDTEEYRNLSRKLLLPVMDQIKEYLKQNYEIVGMIGIENSPSCGVLHTVKKKNGEYYTVDGSGIFIEEFTKLLDQNQLNIPIWEV